MRFTAATVVSLLAGSAIAAPTDINANKASDMSADASSITNMRLADMFSERQMAVLKVLSEHQQELGMGQEEKEMMDAFMAALHDEAAVNVKRQVPVLVPTTINATALGSLGSLGSAIDALNTIKSGAPTGAIGAPGSVTDVLSTLKGIPGLGSLLANATGALGGATSGLGSATSGLSCLTGGLGGLTGGLGGLTGGLRRGGLLGGVLIPGIL